MFYTQYNYLLYICFWCCGTELARLSFFIIYIDLGFIIRTHSSHSVGLLLYLYRHYNQKNSNTQHDSWRYNLDHSPLAPITHHPYLSDEFRLSAQKTGDSGEVKTRRIATGADLKAPSLPQQGVTTPQRQDFKSHHRHDHTAIPVNKLLISNT